ncbi:MAG: hypothetical protein ACRC8S_14255 [Fimbriiglobus sp.]
MAFWRQYVSLVVVLLGLTGGGCAPRAGFHPQNVVQVSPETVVVEPTSGFATLPRAPGERVSRHALPATTEPTTTATPTKDPAPSEPASKPAPPQAPPTGLLTSQTRSPSEVMGSLTANTDSPLVSALRAYMEGKHDVGDEYLKTLAPANRAALKELIPAIAGLAPRSTPTTTVEMSRIVHQLETGTQLLVPRAELTITKTVPCRRIRGYGRFEPLPESYQFSPGSLAEIYVELKNVTAIPKPGGVYLTELETSLRIRKPNGDILELMNEQTVKVPEIVTWNRTVTQTPLRDHHIPFSFEVPKEPGIYSAIFSITDHKTGRSISRGLAFVVAGK